MPVRWRHRLTLLVRMGVAGGLVGTAAVLISALVGLLGGITGWYAVLSLAGQLAATFETTPLLGPLSLAVFERLHGLSPVWLIAGAGIYTLGWTLKRSYRRLDAFSQELAAAGSVDEGVPATQLARLAQLAGIAVPTLRTIDTEQPIAYAVVHETPTVVVSTGLIEALSNAELEAVLAHEVAHLHNKDTKLLAAALLPVLFAEDWGLDYTSGLQQLPYRYAQLGAALVARSRELTADTTAAELTGSPAALASALTTLSADRGSPETDLRTRRYSTAAMNIVAPHTPVGPFQSHPPIETRVQRLRELTTATYA